MFCKLILILMLILMGFTYARVLDADILYFRDGRAYECKVLSYSRDSIEIELTNKKTLWMPKYRILKIQYDNGFIEFYGRDAVQLESSQFNMNSILEAINKYNIIAEAQAHSLGQIAQIQKNFWTVYKVQLLISITVAIVTLLMLLTPE